VVAAIAAFYSARWRRAAGLLRFARNDALERVTARFFGALRFATARLTFFAAGDELARVAAFLVAFCAMRAATAVALLVTLPASVRVFPNCLRIDFAMTHPAISLKLS